MPEQLSMFSGPPAKPKPIKPIKSYSLIYEPKKRAREYAARACNLYRGCDHHCVYCYAPGATQVSRETFGTPRLRAGDFIRKLDREAQSLGAEYPGAQVHLCFTCDPYSHFDVQQAITRQAIQILHSADLTVSILTKGGSRALRDLDLFTPGDAFGTTMTLLDDARSLTWEPNASLPMDRIAAIKAFHEAGIPTWVSLEPVIDPETALEIILITFPYVDLFKVGKMNHAGTIPPDLRFQVDNIDWRKFAQDAIELLVSLDKQYYIKDDLFAFLPDGEYEKSNGYDPYTPIHAREPILTS